MSNNNRNRDNASATGVLATDSSDSGGEESVKPDDESQPSASVANVGPRGTIDRPVGSGKVRRSALGRGLSALIAPKALSIPSMQQATEATNEKPIDSDELDGIRKDSRTSGRREPNDKRPLVEQIVVDVLVSGSGQGVSASYNAEETKTDFETGISDYRKSSESASHNVPDHFVSDNDASDHDVLDNDASDNEVGEIEVPVSTHKSAYSPHTLGSEDIGNYSDTILKILLITDIVPNPNQPRKRFADDELANLANSLRETGVIQPIVVRPISSLESRAQASVEIENERGATTGQYQLVAGERRWRAAQLAGLTEIPALIRKLSDKDCLELAIIENIQRSNLDAIEEALGYQQLVSDFGETPTEIARALGKDRSSIVNALRLLKLPGVLQEMIAGGQLTAGHGRALLMIEDAAQQSAAAHMIIEQGLSVRSAEELARKQKDSDLTQGVKVSSYIRSGTSASENTEELEERLRRALGTKVRVKLQASGRGEIRINFFSAEELENILEKCEGPES